MSITQQISVGTLWQQLCDCFTRDPGLWADVRLALESPDVYLETYRGRLLDRGITAATGVSPWIALVDWLYENDLLVELDGANSSADLYVDLASLPSLATGIDLSPVAVETVHLAFAVPRANAILARSFWTLLYLDIGPGSCPLALVSTEAGARIQQLAAQLGHVARFIDERDADGPVSRGDRGYTVGLPYLPPVYTGARAVNFGKRLLAFLIDAVLLWGVMIGGVSLGIAVNGGDNDGRNGVVGVVILSAVVVYLAVLVVLVARAGQSLGMMALGLRLVKVGTGAPPGYGSAIGRGALSLAFVFWIWGLIVFITVLADPSGRGLNDKAAGTIMTDLRRKTAAF
jgi:uncharacterized RDD family membrane protein YckC